MYNQNMYMNQNMAMSGMSMAGLNMLGAAGSGGMFNNMFMYHGSYIGLQSRLDDISVQNNSNIREATINCTGNQLS